MSICTATRMEEVVEILEFAFFSRCRKQCRYTELRRLSSGFNIPITFPLNFKTSGPGLSVPGTLLTIPGTGSRRYVVARAVWGSTGK